MLRIITTGGTIDKVYFDARSTFEVGAPEISRILEEALVTLEYAVTPLMQKDSLELDDADRARIREAAEQCPEKLVLITHGTDTMAQTAAALEGIPDKTIVLTGALSPARFRATDAIFNVGLAVGAVQSRPPGVYVAMNGRIFKSGSVRKNPERNRFEQT